MIRTEEEENEGRNEIAGVKGMKEEEEEEEEEAEI